ncbi:MAG: hypothetical protein BMS9Abin22_461 [Gammaproteobacteria bacterium]|nr:MAG: hypothetical protein BMS9Abin22_461 [Gammaproteobacteria bacterium]
MRKNVATDENGRTATRQKLESGKFIKNAGSETNFFGQISDYCCDSPLLAGRKSGEGRRRDPAAV